MKKYYFENKAKLKFEYKDDKGVRFYTLKEDLVFIHDKDRIIVPKNIYYTDLASVPKGLQWIFKPNGKYTRASIVHDYLYDNRAISRYKADLIFLRAMKSDNVNFSTRWLFFGMVRFFGSGRKS